MKNRISILISRRFCFLLPLLIIGSMVVQRGYAQAGAQMLPGKAMSSDQVNQLINNSQNAISFTENRGQWPAHVLYRADVPGGQMLATPQGMLIGVFDRSSLAAISDYNMKLEQMQARNLQGSSVKDLGPAPALRGHGWRLNFLGGTAATAQSIDRQGESQDVSNYFSGDPSTYASGVHGYYVLTYKDVYQGINVKYYTGKDGSLENDIVVNPGADASRINIQVEGIDQLHLDANGALILPTTVGDITIPHPVSYLLSATGQRTEINIKYKVTGKNVVSFDIPAYDKSLTLVIDPIVMRWATLISSTSNIDSHCHGIDLDASGNIYVVGKYGTGLITIGAFQTTNPGSNDDLFISEYQEPATPGGSGTRVWQTYLGSTQGCNPYAVNVSADGYLYITGITSDNLATTYGTGAPTPGWKQRNVVNSGQQVFIAKVITTGAWAEVRQLGDSINNLTPYLFDIRLLATGSSTYDLEAVGYVTQQSGSSRDGDIPAPQYPNGTAASGGSGNQSGYALRISSDLNTIKWTKQYTSNGSNNRFAISNFDYLGHILVGGLTNGSSDISYNNPSTQTTLGGSQDGWLIALDTANGTAAWSRYFQSASNKTTSILCMELNLQQSQFIIGGMTSTLATANTTTGAYAKGYPGSSGQDFYIASLPVSGASTTWGTYFGGTGSNGSDNMMGLNIDQNNDVYVLGYTNSKFVPTTIPANGNPIQTDSYDASDYDAIFFKLSGTTGDTLLYYTFLGGKGDEEDPIGERGIKFNECRIYLAITSRSNDFPLTTGTIDSVYSPNQNATYLPLIVSMANPPDLLDNGIISGGNQSITCGEAPAQITAGVPSYIIPEIIRDKLPQTDSTAGAYPDGLPRITSYQWQSSTNNGVTWTSIAGATGQDYTPVIVDSFIGTIKFRRIIDNDACNRASDTNAVATVFVTPPYPAPPITTNTPVCLGDTIDLSTTAQSGYTYAWSGPNGFTSTLQDPQIPDASAIDTGFYKLTVKNSSNGCPSYPDSADVGVSSVGLPTPTANASPNPVCSGGTLTLTATNVTPGATYTWTGPGYSESSTTNPVTINPVSTANAGSYTVVQSSGGCKSASSAPVTVVVNASPSITSTTSLNPSTCGGTNGTITLNGLADDSTYSVSYSLNNAPLTTVTLTSNASGQIVITGLGAGAYTDITVTIHTCTSSPVAGTITLTNPTTPGAPIVSSNTPVCSGDTIKLFATGQGGATYTWTSNPTGFTSGLQDPIIANATTGEGISYCATQTVAGCTSTAACTSVTVNSTPSIASAAGVSPTTCGGTNGTITLSGLNDNQTYAVTYSRDGIGQGSSNLTSSGSGQIIISGMDSGVYTHFVVTTQALCPSAAYAGPVVLTNPAIPSAPGVSSNTPVCQGDTIKLFATGQGSASFSWTSNPTGFTSSSQDPIITNATLAEGISYCATQTVANCISPQACTSVVVNPTPVITSSSSTNPDSCGGSEGTITLLGLTASQTYSVTYLKNLSPVSIPSITANVSGRIVITGLGAGTYSDFVVTLNGCPSAPLAGTITLSNPEAPQAPSVTTNSPVCQGDTVYLFAGTTIGASYSWTSTPAGFTSSLQNPFIPDASVGTVDYCVTQTVANCTSLQTCNEVTVNPRPVITSVIGSNPTSCGGNQGTITINGLTSSLSYTVTYLFNNASQGPLPFTANGSGQIVISGLVIGTYSNIVVTLNGCSSNSAGPVVLMNPTGPNTPIATTDAPVCAGNALTLGVNTTNGATYQWSGPLNYSAFSSSVTVSNNAQPTMSGPYKVVVTLNNCQDSSTVNAVVNYNPVVSAGNGGAYCANSGGSVILGGSPTVTDQSSGTFSYAWSPKLGLNDSTSSNPVATPTSTTTYSLTVSDGNSCSATGSATVTVNPLPVAHAGDDTAVCSGQSVQLGGFPAATGGTPGSGYTYDWNNGAANTSNPTVTPLSTITYTLTVTDSKTCSATASQTVTVNPNPTANAGSPKDIPSCSLTGTQIGGNPTASGGTGPYTFVWSPASGLTNDTTADPDVVGIGSSESYTVTVTDLNKCSATSSVLVTVDSSNLSVVISANGSNTWCSASNGSITFTAIPTGGTPGYTYLWTGTNLSSDTTATTIASPNTGGTYTYSVVITDHTGCQTGTSTTVTVNPSPVASAGPLDTVCSGVAVTLGGSPTVTGGTGPTFTYQWSEGAAGISNPSVTLTNNSSNPTTTTYNLTVTDSKDCSATATTSVTVNPNPTANAGPDHTVASCTTSGPTLGGTPTASGGTMPYHYIWSPDQGLSNDTTANPKVVAIGQSTDYTVTVTDANGCSASSSAAFNVTGTSLSVVFVENTSLFWCAGSGGTVTFTAIATGGSAPYSYQWFGTDLSVDTGFYTTANPDQPGTYLYSVIVTDSTGCQAGNTVPVQVFISPVASAGDSSYTICKGQNVTLGGNPTANSGTTPYRYAWSGGASAVANPSVSPPITTTYTLVVTDSNSCTATASTTVNVNPLPSASAGPNVTLPSCSPTGIVIGGTPTAGLGTPGYTYSWTPNLDLSSNTVSNPTVVGLTVDTTYTVLVTDTNGCTNSAEVSVTVTNNSPSVSISPATSHYCTGSGTSETLTAVVTGGSPTFNYSWSGSAVTPNNSSVASADPNLPGTYTYAVAVTDQFNCTTSATATITVNPNPVANAGIPDTICNGTSATLGSDSTASGGTPPYRYAWSGGAQSIANPSVSPSTNTQYNVVVTDTNGCTATSGVTVVVNPNPVANAGGPNITLPACSPTGVQIGGTPSASGGMPPYKYAWSPDVDLSSDSVADPIVAGLTSDTLYTLVVTDNNGCSASAEVSVNVTNNPPVVGITADGHTHWCAGTNDHVDLTATVNGGSGIFTYSWSGSFISPTNTSLVMVDPDTPGTYTYYVTVTDGYNCSATDSFSITIYPNPTADAGGPFTICSGNSVQIGNNPTASGGTGSYTYSWSGGASPVADPTVNPSTTTTYTVIVTDLALCTAVSSATVNVSPAPKADAGPDVSIYACSGSNATIGGSPTASGGSGIYTYHWSPSAGLSDTAASNPVVSGIDSTTTYTLVVSDTTGCTATDEVTVHVIPSSLQANAGLSKAICSGPNACVQIGATPTAAGGIPPYSYNWSNSGTLTPPDNSDPLACPLATTTYALTLTDAIGCLAYDSVTITVNPSPVANAGDDTTICLGQSVVIGGSPSGSGGTGVLTYFWDTPFYLSSRDSSNPTASPTITITYGLLVTDSKGCTSASDVTVAVRSIPTANAGPDQTLVACNGDSVQIGGAPSATGGTGPYTYTWTPAGGLFGPDSSNPWVSHLGGNSIYQLVVTDSFGCMSLPSGVAVTVTNPSLQVNAGSDVSFCKGANVTVTLGGNPTARGNNDGPYTYSWTPTTGIPALDTTIANPVATVKTTTTYYVQVEDAFGCLGDDSIRITINPLPIVNAGNNDTVCAGGCVLLGGNPTATGGAGGYTYTWSPGTYLSSADTSNPLACPLADISYIVTVTDTLGCSSTGSVSVKTSNLRVTTGPNQTICAGNSVQLTGSVTGVAAGYTVSWSPDSGFLTSNTILAPTVKPSVTTTYYLTVSDSLGCNAIDSTTVFVNPAVVMGTLNTKTVCSGTGVILGGNPTASGGTRPLSYAWNNGAANTSNPAITNPTVTTTYCVTVTDHAGCSASACQTVIVDPAVMACAGPQGLSMTNCVGSSVTLGCTPTANGGSGEFSYQWSPDTVAGVSVLNNDTTSNPVVSGLIQSTVFTVTVTDIITGCSATASVGVTVNQSTLVANAGPNVSTCGNTTTCITIGGNPTASGGVGPYTYNWAPPRPIIGQNQLSNPCVYPDNLPTPDNTFYVTVTDHLGCTAVDSMNFYVSPFITAFAGDDTTICSGQSVELGGFPTGTGGTGSYTYLWQPSTYLTSTTTSNPVAQNVTTNITYTVTVFDSLGCSANSSINILTRALPVANAGPDFSLFPCSHDSIVLQGSASGGTPGYTYQWSPHFNFCTTCPDPVVDSVGATTQFCLVVTDTFGCQSAPSCQTTTVLPKTLFVSAGSAPAICANSGSCVTLDGTASGGAGGYTFQWFGGTFTPNASVFDPQVCPTSTTTYTLVVTDSKSCQASDTVQVVVQPQPVVYVTGLNTKYCINAGNVTMTGVPAGGTFSGPGVTGNVFQPSVIGVGTWSIQYSYTSPVTHCSADTTITVTVNPLPVVNISGYAARYCKSSSCVTLTGTPAGGTWSGAGVSPSGEFCPANGNSTADTIGYTYTDQATGCSNTTQVIITISPTPSLSISVASDTVCAGNSVTLIPTYSVGVDNVIWSQEGGSTIGAGEGSFTFTPTGTTYCVVGMAVNSGTGCSVKDTICFNISQPPVANPVYANTCQGQSVVIPVLENVVPSGAYTVSITTTAHGTATVLNDTIHYTASATDTATTDTIFYTACSVSCPNNCSTSEVIVSICHVSKPPVIISIIDTIYENTTAYVCPPISDPNGYPLIVTPNFCGSLTNGIVQQTTDSCFTFIPNHDWIGTEVICVVVCSNHGLCDTGTVTIVVLPANQPPIAGRIDVDICAGTTIGINIASATTDPEGNPVTFSYGLMTGPGAATWDVTGAGSADFQSSTPGQYIMPYTICNHSDLPVNSLCASNYIVINVINCSINPDDSIQANNDYEVTNINTRLLINELANDYYPNASALGVSVLVGSHLAGSSWSLNANGTINYSSPTVGYDSIVYQICDPAPLCSTATIYIYVDSSGVTHYPPVAVDDFDTTDYLTPITLFVLNNDYSQDGTPFTITALPCAPLKGTDSISNNGSTISYTPGASATSLSPDTFCYKICDVGFPTLCDTATVVVFIRGKVVAVNDTAETGQHNCIDINVLANDYDPQHFSFGIVQLITTNTTGSATIDTVGGKQMVHFCPDGDSCGFVDQFQYVIQDAAGAKDTATVYVTVVCCPIPIAATDSITMLPGTSATINPFANDTNSSGTISGGVLHLPQHGTAHFINDTDLVYTPYPNYCGPDTIVYIGKSLCGLDTGLILVGVYCELQPIAVADTEYICKNDIINIPVLRNDTAFNGNTLHITGISNLLPDNIGQVIEVTSDVISFEAEGQVGTVRFNYYSCDNGYVSLCDTGSVVIFIQACQSPTVTIIYDTTFINTSDTICAGGAVTSKSPWQIVSLCNPPSGGSAMVNEGDTCFTYTPGTNFVGNDTFCIIICGNIACDTSKVIVTVLDTFIKAVPLSCDVDTTTPDMPLTMNVLANDLIPLAFDTTVTLLTQPAQGSAVVNPDHSVTYTPAGKYIGDETENFIYQVCIIDGSREYCDTADICVTVLGPCFIPDAFSPNGDHINDQYVIPCQDDHPNATLKIYDRWGMEVWDSNGPYLNNWDGKNQQGTVLPDGTYYMIFQYNDGTGRSEAKFVVIHR